MSAPELDSDRYDVVIIGTGVAESIAAASLAKSGKTVLHLDPNEYYGSTQASLTLDELIQWSATQAGPSTPSPHSYSKRYSCASTTPLTPQLEKIQRRYALSLFPSVLPSRGALIDTLIASDVSKYVSFRMLDAVSFWKDSVGGARRVPGSKEEVFKDKTIGLVEKRRLMRFLMWSGGEFEGDEILRGREDQPLVNFLEESFHLSNDLAEAITYVIAHCSSAGDPTLPALKRTRRYLRSIGRYGSGAFLIGQYGGAGEVAQGFCRACAVFGGTYVLGSSAQPETIEVQDASDGTPAAVRLKVPCHPRAITASHLICPPDHLPDKLRPANEAALRTTANAIAILPGFPDALQRTSKLSATEEAGGENVPESDDGEDDTAVVIFPPENGGQVVKALVMGEGTGSCPSSQCILYLSTVVSAPIPDPSEILRPYLDKIGPSSLFKSHYLSTQPATQPLSGTLLPSTSPAVLVLNAYSGPEMLTEGLDWDAEQGEVAFWTVMGGKNQVAEGEGKRFFERRPGEGDEAETDL